MSGHSKWAQIKRQKRKSFLFIDGTNLYAGQYQLFGPDEYLDFPSFITAIEEELGLKFDKIYFYASYSPKPKRLTKKIKNYLKNEYFFYKSVRRVSNVSFIKGYRSKTTGKEKEVDVRLGVDIVDMAHRNLYQVLFLLTGDADFMRSLEIAEQLDKKIQILALENRIPMRFSFHFPTYAFVIRDRRQEGRFEEKQKIKIIYLDRKEIVKRIK